MPSRFFKFTIFLTLFFTQATSAYAYSRIVTLAPVLSEWTAELLGKALTQKHLVGTSEYSNYPDFVKAVPTIGSYVKLDVEKIASLHPDLILGSAEYNSSVQIEQLKRLKLRVILLPTETFAEMPVWIKNLGTVLGSEKRAGELATRWVNEVNALKKNAKVPSKTLYVEIQHSPLVTIGGASFLNEAFALIGYQNIFKQLTQAYPKVTTESVLKAKPATIFILDSTGEPSETAKAQADWQKYGFSAKVISGDLFARCGFLLLQGLKSL